MATDTPPRLESLGPLTTPVDAVGGTAGAVTFGALSALRRRRVFHPVGIAFDAVVDVSGGAATGIALLDAPARHRAVVRVSRGVGLPAPVPDVLGLAVRILDADGEGQPQDVLLVTSGEAPVVRHALLPAVGFGDLHLSSVTPYRAAGRLVVLGARPHLSQGTPSPRFGEDLVDALQDGRLRYELELAPLTGPWQAVARIDVGRRWGQRESDALRFNPFNAIDELRPVGVLNTLRRRAYAGSQQGRQATGEPAS